MILPLKSLASSRIDGLENTSFKVILSNILIAVPETKRAEKENQCGRLRDQDHF